MSINLRSPFNQPPHNALLSRHNSLPLWRRRRRFKIKPSTLTPHFAVRCHFGNFISDFVTRFPSVDTIAPALGLASGLGFYIHKLNNNTKQQQSDDGGGGEWMLFTTPSPFNRFVFLRCPSLCFVAKEDVNERLLKEDRHLVRVGGSGGGYGGSRVVEELLLEYRRLCVPTDDGGVIALDLPAHLDLGEDDGLDTTLLLVPGSAEGSMDRNVQMFVSESLKRGCFPVVLNPRGCAGSPLTTPRMFTAADSDDVCKAVQFISKMRPRTAIMGVGWGYGANMLTKYLAEVGDKTPLAAATCFDNPFDLPEVSKTFQQNHFDQKLLNGLKNILRSNKEIFQGRINGFEVERALQAGSLREFETFISMISYGFQKIEDFYSVCSTHYAVTDIRIPVLFIQSDHEIQQLFYAPHSSIAENPFASLLICSSSPNLIDVSGPVVSWCHYVTIEWLAAVELGVLKGHHSLMEDVDARLCLPRGRAYNESGKAKLLTYGQKEFSNDHHMDISSEMHDRNAVTTTSSRPGIHSQTHSGHESMSLQQTELVEEKSVEARSLDTDEGSAAENDRGQVLQTAQIVLNMLEVSMPGTFSPEQKEKALTAVGQGATVLNALQDAVPEDAREKLTTTVSEILQTGKNLKLDGFLKRGQKSIVLSDPESGVIGKGKEVSDVDGSSSQNSTNGAVHLDEHELDNSNLGNNQKTEMNDARLPGEEGNAVQSQLIDDLVDHGAVSVPEGNVDSVDGVTESSVKNKVAHSNDNTPTNFDQEEKVSVNGNETSFLDSALGDKESTVDQSQGKEIHGTPQEVQKNTPNNEEKDQNSSADPNKIELPAEIGHAVSSSKSDSVSDVQTEVKDIATQKVQDNSLPDKAPPSIKISEAFDALAGMDDSTQVAVNSVFGVIEGMITQLEEKTDSAKDTDSEKPHLAVNNNSDIEEKENSINKQNAKIKDSSSSDYSGDTLKPQHSIMNEKADERIVQRSSQDENHHRVINNSPDSKEKGNKLHQLNGGIKMSYIYDGPGYSLELNHKIINEVGETVIQRSSQCNEDPSWSHGARLGDEEDNDQANSSNLSCTLPYRETNLCRSPLHDSEKHKMSNLQDIEIPDINVRTSACLDYLIEEGQWNHLEQSGFSSDFDTSSTNPTNGFAGLERVTDKGLQPENTTIYTERPKKHVDDRDKEKDVLEVGETKNERVHDLDDLSSSMHMEGNASEKNNGMDFFQSSECRMLEVSENIHSDKSISENDSGMVGAVTAAVGASALLMQDSYMNQDNTETVAKSLKKKEYKDKEPETQNNLVSSIADKAMSVAGPVVPMDENGSVDQERLVSMLANVGQNGGFLRIVGKFALLWGAMSLTQKLISFLHLSERPLFQRLIGFGGLVILLWSPVYIPLLPTLVRGWATHSPSKSAELSCIIGLYAAVTVLIMMWGKQIRGFERPLKQYGLDFTLPALKQFMFAYVGGALIILSIHYVNTVIGCATVSMETCMPLVSSTWLPEFGKCLLLVAQGTVSATGVALVEELLFRSWLPAEISKEFGFHIGIIVAGFTFSVFQRSLGALPGLWLLSLALAGAKERSQGSLSTPIGFRAGMMTTTYVLQKIGVLTYLSKVPMWFKATDPIQPISGITGLAFSLLLAVYLYPRQSGSVIKAARKIRE